MTPGNLIVGLRANCKNKHVRGTTGGRETGMKGLGGKGRGPASGRRKFVLFSIFFLIPSCPVLYVRLSSTGNGNTNFAEYSGWTAVSARWETVVWVVITWG